MKLGPCLEQMMSIYERKILRSIFGGIQENGTWRRRSNLKLYRSFKAVLRNLLIAADQSTFDNFTAARCGKWITKQKTGSQQKVSSCHRLMKARSDRRIVEVIQSNRRATMRQIARNLNQGAIANVSE
ncbi:hypothetical protein TNCV_2140681 [Trichonephila clavipes]|uniref:Uncharacterized protein n=1 Tax=Trichonephila clavipes TaxID=2585209 RepID=A0A8X6RTB7_TRICX|nr:hypothetical protein TNCV_2140681 [Trichonephila clavipes]